MAGAVGIEPTSAVLETAILADELCPYRLANGLAHLLYQKKIFCKPTQTNHFEKI